MKRMSLIILALVVACGLGCGVEGQGTLDAAATTYTGARGRIEQLPDSTGQIYITLNPIPEFRNPNDSLVRLDTTTMPFFLGEGVDTTGLRADSMITFDLLVDWDTVPLPGIIVRIDREGD